MKGREGYNKARNWEDRLLDGDEKSHARLALGEYLQGLLRYCDLPHHQVKEAYRAYLKVGGYFRLTHFLPPEDEDEDEDEEATEADRFNELQEVRSEQS